MLGYDMLFQHSYSPNLNVIERLWKFTKAKALRGEHHWDFVILHDPQVPDLRQSLIPRRVKNLLGGGTIGPWGIG